jgi:hypothetical protein
MSVRRAAAKTGHATSCQSCLTVNPSIRLFAFSIGVRREVTKGVEDRNGHEAVLGVARPQGVEGLGMAGLSDALRSSWPPFAIRPWLFRSCDICAGFKPEKFVHRNQLDIDSDASAFSFQLRLGNGKCHGQADHLKK